MFELVVEDVGSRARRGRVTTAHGVIETPVFMPVGTLGAVKTLSPVELVELGAQVILGNTYHLMIRPGLDIIGEAGGLHRFIGWDRPILTDSGGYQVFSLSRIRKVREHGVEFQSHLDGSPLFLGPKEAMAAQALIGSDIAMAFDECPPHDAPESVLEALVERTIRWAAECREQARGEGQLVFGIVQGASHGGLRQRCAEALIAMDFDGYAIGGVSVGEPEPEMLKAIDLTEPHLPRERPRYAMGLGTPAQLVELVARGVDMFDCVLPTRIARNGTAFTRRGAISIKAAYNKTDWGPIEEGCDCYACRNFSKAYLRHLFNVEEILGLRLLSLHNVHMFCRLMDEVRRRIDDGSFAEFREAFVAGYEPTAVVKAARVASEI